ncbi:MAG: cytochrome c biogenesis protein [Candidatus Hydrogenedentes bacterium]|nr:cytochrome c biogenesis protein [Candidatus Hydrogenedentota bacterium]
MTSAIYGTFSLAFFLYVASAATAGWYLHSGGKRILRVTHVLVMIGSVVLATTIALRWIAWGRLPLTTMADALNLFIVLTSLVVAIVAHRGAQHAILCLYTPPLVALFTVNAVIAFSDLHSEPKELNGAFLAVHVGLAVLAYALFFVASITSIAYVVQARGLKQIRTSGLVKKLPALEQLDKTLYFLIALGYIFFGITLVLGMIWAYIDRDALGPYWFLSPKIFRAAFMVLLYSTAFHARRRGQLRGQRLAYLVFVGFTIMLAGYLVLGLFDVQDYNFWSTSS